MPKRYDLKEIEEILREKGLYLIEKEYKNSKNKLKLIDCNGYKYYNNLSNIMDGKKIDKFNPNNPYTIDNIKLWLKESEYKNKLISTSYINSSSPMLFTCEKCGQPYNVTLLDLRNKKRTKCKQCSGGIKREKITLENAIFILKESGFIIINEKEFINSKNKINIMDLEGYKYLINISDFILYKKDNNKIDKFSKFNPHTIDNIKLYLKLNGYNNELISEEYKSCDKSLIFTCETCKKEYEVTFKHLRNSNQTRCKECSTSQSTIEKLVKDYLDCNNYNYIQQYIFEDCCDVRPLPFDFCILNNKSIEYLIEVDGRQHHEIVAHFGGEDEYEYIKKHDSIKNKYCEDNNIKLIRIPYWEFKKNKYINILKNKLQ